LEVACADTPLSMETRAWSKEQKLPLGANRHLPDFVGVGLWLKASAAAAGLRETAFGFGI